MYTIFKIYIAVRYFNNENVEINMNGKILIPYYPLTPMVHHPCKNDTSNVEGGLILELQAGVSDIRVQF